jgi:hypothetical protein
MTSTAIAAPAPLSRDETGRLLGHTMGLVALDVLNVFVLLLSIFGRGGE